MIGADLHEIAGELRREEEIEEAEVDVEEPTPDRLILTEVVSDARASPAPFSLQNQDDGTHRVAKGDVFTSERANVQ